MASKITLWKQRRGYLVLFLGALLCVQMRCFGQLPNPEQRYLIDIWQTENGLPENIVNAIAQTHDGYLWCGTTHGLARFDGVRFKVFNPQNTPALGSARIRQLFVDRRGTLWITVFEGTLVRYEDGIFQAFSLPPRASTAKTIFWMTDDPSGALWLTVEDGAVYRFFNGEFTHASALWTSEGTPVFRVLGDHAGGAWVATSLGLSRIEQGVLVPVLHGKQWQYQILCASRSGGWWLQTAGRVRLWRDGQFVADAGLWIRPDRTVESSLEDRAGRLWVASLGKGVFCYSTNAAARQFTMNDGLGSDLVRSLFEDSEGNLWAGTRPGGLNRLRPALFQTYGRKQGLASDLVTAICQGRDGELWVGTDGEGVNRLRGETVDHFDKEHGLEGRHVRALLQDQQGTLWAGSWAGGLYRLDRDVITTNAFAAFRDIPGRDTPVAALFADSQARLWLGQRSLNRLVYLQDGKAGSVALPNPGPALDIICIEEDAQGTIWAGTDGSGLYACHGGTVRRFTRREGLPSDTVRALHAEPDGALWVGTVDGGLCRFKNGRFNACTTREGLIDDVVNHIADDGAGYFWLTTFQGICRIRKSQLNDFADGKIRRVDCEAYGRSDGLPALECPGGFQPAGCRTADGRLWFPTIKGLVSVDPKQVTTNAVPPRC